MVYDKPKVNIDLDEYLDLKKENTELRSDSQLIAAKRIIIALLQFGGNIGAALKALEAHNIRFSIKNQHIVDLDVDDLVISTKNKQQ